jgi:hypothetical protein
MNTFNFILVALVASTAFAAPTGPTIEISGPETVKMSKKAKVAAVAGAVPGAVAGAMLAPLAAAGTALRGGGFKKSMRNAAKAPVLGAMAGATVASRPFMRHNMAQEILFHLK